MKTKERFKEQSLDDSYSARVEHEIYSTEFSTVNPWATFDHPHTMRQGLQGGAPLEEYDNTIEFGEVYREKTENSDFRNSYKTNYVYEENSIEQGVFHTHNHHLFI